MGKNRFKDHRRFFLSSSKARLQQQDQQRQPCIHKKRRRDRQQCSRPAEPGFTMCKHHLDIFLKEEVCCQGWKRLAFIDETDVKHDASCLLIVKNNNASYLCGNRHVDKNNDAWKIILDVWKNSVVVSDKYDDPLLKPLSLYPAGIWTPRVTQW